MSDSGGFAIKVVLFVMAAIAIAYGILRLCTTSREDTLRSATDYATHVQGATAVRCDYELGEAWQKCNILRGDDLPLSVTCNDELCTTFDRSEHNTVVVPIVQPPLR